MKELGPCRANRSASARLLIGLVVGLRSGDGATVLSGTITVEVDVDVGQSERPGGRIGIALLVVLGLVAGPDAAGEDMVDVGAVIPAYLGATNCAGGEINLPVDDEVAHVVVEEQVDVASGAARRGCHRQRHLVVSECAGGDVERYHMPRPLGELLQYVDDLERPACYVGSSGSRRRLDPRRVSAGREWHHYARVECGLGCLQDVVDVDVAGRHASADVGDMRADCDVGDTVRGRAMCRSLTAEQRRCGIEYHSRVHSLTADNLDRH